jgi:hypothetical protein
MGAVNGISEKTLAAIRAKARRLAAEAPIPGDEQIRIIAPLLGHRGETGRRTSDAA